MDLGNFLVLQNIINIGNLNRDEKKELDQVVIDVMEYKTNYEYYIDPEVWVDANNLNCTSPNSVDDEFQYLLFHIYELWYIYCSILALCSCVHILRLLIMVSKKKKGMIFLSGVRFKRDE